ncbi:glyoxylate/hydroxypyruvate reductase A [Mesorhizobium sp. M0340]|uniref:2-hydroxyacid dehydrogenase n=1 Tax=Mesorhizobium sp. M0340 TaxID=2956939 RepID=UPI003339FEC4
MKDQYVRSPIAFVSRLSVEEENTWTSLLSSLLPGEDVIPFREMSDDQRKLAEIAIVANPDPAELVEMTGLRWIHSVWAGVERLMAELAPGGPPVVRLVDPELSRTMAEAVLASSLYLQRDMPQYARQQRQSLWQARPYRHPSKLMIGFLGTGELGTCAARTLQQVGFRVAGWSRTPKPGSFFDIYFGNQGLDRLLTQADIVICLLPLTPETKGLLNAKRLSSMKAGASIVNFARGPIIDTDALVQLLDIGHLSHAVLDVFDQEPLDRDSPLWLHPHITVLPHISGPTDCESAARIVASNIQSYRHTGVVPAAVDRVRGY